MARGAHGRQGPAPDPNALKRERDEGDWVVLPPARDGDAPVWPLSEPTDREQVLWTREWRRPQAVMWERNGQELEVALYVRAVAAAEQLDATVASRTLVRQQQEALGLSIPGLLRNRWRIERELPSAVAGAEAEVARSRFRVVSDDGGG